MAFGPNLHLMAPFEALEAGFCTEFAAHLLYFQSPEQIWGARVGNWDPQVRFWDFQVDIVGRRRFWGPKKDTLARKGFSGGDAGESFLPK